MYRVLKHTEKYIKLYDAFNIFDRHEILQGLWVNNTSMSSNKGAYCYIIPCRPNTVYEVSREALTTRHIVACSTEYPATTTTLQKTINMGTNLSTYIKTLNDTKYLVIYFGVNSFAADSQIKWNVRDTTIILNKWESGDYNYQTGKPIEDARRQRTPQKYRIKIIPEMTYTIELPFTTTFGLRIYDSNNNFVKTESGQNVKSLTFKAHNKADNALIMVFSLKRDITVKISLTESNATVLSDDVDDVTE